MRLTFIVESGTDVRLVEQLARRFDLDVFARRIVGGREISQETDAAFRFSAGPPGFARFALAAAARVIRARRGGGVIVVQGYGLAALAVNLAARCTRQPVLMLVCSPTEAYYRCRRLELAGRPFRWIEWRALGCLAWLNARAGQGYLVLSPYLAGVVRQHGTRRPVSVVPVYGVDMDVFRPLEGDRTSLRQRLGLPHGPALVFFSSRVAPEKDPDALLDAVGRLRRSGRDVRILHRSGGHEEFSRRAAAAGMAEAVIAGGAVPPGPLLADYYRAVDVCVQASREEGLGFSPLEALACGVPVVAAAAGGLRDTIVDGLTGWTYPPGDGAALARVLAAALDDPAEGQRRANRGRAMVAGRYERGAVFDAFAALIETLGRGRTDVVRGPERERKSSAA